LKWGEDLRGFFGKKTENLLRIKPGMGKTEKSSKKRGMAEAQVGERGEGVLKAEGTKGKTWGKRIHDF